MSKKDAFRKLAKQAGIKDPEIDYHPSRKAYSIGIMIRTPDKQGFYAPSIGLYYALEEAQERLQADLKAFLEKYPEALDKVTNSYHSVTKEETALSPKELTHNLLEQLLAGVAGDELKALAETALSYLNRLEAPKIKANNKASASGRYRSRYPSHDKQAIEWNQPGERLAPVYRFELDCPYCGRHVSLERFSPREPRHCGQDDCRVKHERELARVRKQRQRAREKK